MRNIAMRAASLMVPVALLLYAGCRWLDGRDGSHGPGLWWNLGHAAFLVTWLSFALLAVLMTRQLRGGEVLYPAVAAACLEGIAAFVWVTVTDIFQNLTELPDPLRNVGPLLFLIGFCVLLGGTARQQHNHPWLLYPALTFAAIVAVAASLALLPVTALLFLAALAPCRSKGVPMAVR